MSETNGDEEVCVIMCRPTAWPDGGLNVPGTVEAMASCGHEVWIAPSSMELSVMKEYQTRCIPCALADPKFKESIEKNGLNTTREQRDELSGVMGESAVERLIQALGLKDLGDS